MKKPEIFSLCCGGKRCPVVTIDDSEETCIITDDYNGKVTLTIDQLKMLSEKVQNKYTDG